MIEVEVLDYGGQLQIAGEEGEVEEDDEKLQGIYYFQNINKLQ